MRRIFFGILSAFLVAACGAGGGKSAIVKACMDEGETRENCTCMADVAEEELDEELFGLLAKAAKSSDEGLGDLGSEMTLAQAGQFMSFGVNVASRCSFSFN
ncbi:MAG: hypothetical protein AAF950_00425 [Pseudomonadota bacterium]